jgi:dynein heavy chain
MCNLLETYLPEVMEKEEMDPSTILDKDWGSLVSSAVQIRNDLQGQQATFKKSLVVGVTTLIDDVKDFRKDFEENGPAVPGIEPKEALNRLRLFSDEFSIRDRKNKTYFAGETLFGLPHQKYPALEETQKQIELLDKLYSLYSKVKDTISKWKDISWTEIKDEIDKMKETIDTFDRDCKKLPGQLKQWDAFKELKEEIENMKQLVGSDNDEITGVVKALAKDTIKDRHW